LTHDPGAGVFARFSRHGRFPFVELFCHDSIYGRKRKGLRSRS
jgi:hypothetical protein